MPVDRLSYLLLCLPLVALITWRLALDFTQEDGPLALYRMVRQIAIALGEKISALGWVARGVECIFCVSFWVSLAAALIFVWPFSAGFDWVTGTEWLVLALASSGLVSAYAKYIGY